MSSTQSVNSIDKKFKKTISRKKNLNYYKNYKDLLERENLDLVIICMTNDIAPKITIEQNSGIWRDLNPRLSDVTEDSGMNLVMGFRR